MLMDYLFQPLAAYFLFHLLKYTTSVVTCMNQVTQAVPAEVLVIMAGLP